VLNLRDASIRRKLIATVMITTLVAMLLLSAAFVTYEVVTQRRLLASRAQTVAEMIGIHSAAALTFHDVAAAEETLEALRAERGARWACLFDESGVPFARYTRPGEEAACRPPGPEEHGVETSGGDLELVHRIEIGGERAGSIRLRWDVQEVREQIRNVAMIVVGALLLTAGLAALATARLQRSIARPLSALVGGSEAMSGGDLSVRVQAHSRDELGVLANAFNGMAGSLGQVIAEVRKSIRAVASAADELRTTGGELSAETGRQREVVEATASAVVGMSDSIATVNENVTHLEEAARDTEGSLREMDASATEIAQHMDGLAGSIEVTSTSILQLSSSIRQITENMGQLDGATQSTSRSLQDLHSSVARVGSNARKCHGLSQGSAEQAEQGRSSVEETISAMQQIEGGFTGLQGIVRDLEQKSESIGEIVKVIEDVTNETSLLSLNASIIAAQSGEHGRAFAVVATSIKGLADRTAGSTREIVQLVGGVQGEIRRAAQSMDTNATWVSRGVERSNQAGEALQRILQSAHESAAMVHEIVESCEDQARDLAQVDEAMASVKEIVAGIDRSIREHRNASSEIAESTERIGGVGEQVKRSVEEQSERTKGITRAMEQVTSMIEDILASTRQQQAQREQMREALESFRAAVAENARRAGSLEHTVDALHDRSEHLERAIDRFRLGEDEEDAPGAVVDRGIGRG